MDADRKPGETAEERGRRHAKIAVAYRRQLLEEGVDRSEARELTRAYMVDLLFAEIGQALEQRFGRKPEDDEPWRG